MNNHDEDCGCLYCDYPHIGINAYKLSEDERFKSADDVEETHVLPGQWEVD